MGPHILFIVFSTLAYAHAQEVQEYIAAAIQYPPRGWEGMTYSELLIDNLPYIEADMIYAKEAGVQIAVLPEAVFYWAGENSRNNMQNFCEDVPDVSNGYPYANPCLNFTNEERASYPTLSTISCMALKLKMMIVINMCDIQYCSSFNDSTCPPDGRYQFNTEVVFSEEGQILAKYHKTHLAGENSYFDQPFEAEVAYFDTSFGVRFGMFTCYDIEFNYPALELYNMGIRNFVYSASWINTPPIYVSVILHQGLSRALSSNFIASNSGAAPAVAGGGIYSSGEPLNFYFNPNATGVDKVLVATLPAAPLNNTLSQSSEKKKMEIKKTAEVIGAESMACSFFGLEGNCTYVSAYSGAQGDIASITPGTLETGIDCFASFSVSESNPNAQVDYVLFAFSGSSHLPNSSSVLELQSCTFFQCVGAPYYCEYVWDSKLAFDYVEVKGAFLNPSIEILPLFGVNDCQVLPSSFLDIAMDENNYTVTANGGTNGQGLYSIGFQSQLAL